MCCRDDVACCSIRHVTYISQPCLSVNDDCIPVEYSFHLGAPAQSPNQITVDVLSTTEHLGLNVSTRRLACAPYYDSTYSMKYSNNLSTAPFTRNSTCIIRTREIPTLLRAYRVIETSATTCRPELDSRDSRRPMKFKALVIQTLSRKRKTWYLVV